MGWHGRVSWDGWGMDSDDGTGAGDGGMAVMVARGAGDGGMAVMKIGRAHV